MKRRLIFTVMVVSPVVIVATALGLAARAQAPNHARYIVTDLGTLGGTYSYAYGINNLGVVSGAAATPSQNDYIAQTAFIWARGALTNLGTLDAADCPDCYSEAAATSMNGTVAIDSETANFDPNGEDFCAFGTHRQCVAALWKNGVMTALPLLPGGNNSKVYWINNSGQAAGVSETGTQDSTCKNVTPYQLLQFEAVIWEPNGQIKELQPLNGDTVAFAFGINDNGEAIGVSGLCSNTSAPPVSPASSEPHGVLWDKNGSPIDIGSLGGEFTVPSGINDRDEVVGASLSSTDGTIHPFLWTKQAGIQDLGTFPGAFITFIGCCHTINNRGQAVGASVSPDGPRAVLFDHGQKVYLNNLIPADSGWDLQLTISINDAGEIVGQGVNPKGEYQAFLLTPVGRTKATIRENLGAFATGIPCCHTINNSGQVVGFSAGAAGPHAYLWEHGEMIDLNTAIPAASERRGSFSGSFRSKQAT